MSPRLVGGFVDETADPARVEQGGAPRAAGASISWAAESEIEA